MRVYAAGPHRCLMVTIEVQLTAIERTAVCHVYFTAHENLSGTYTTET